MLKVKNIITKKGAECPVLAFEKGDKDIYLTFDVRTIARVTGLTMKEIYTLDGDFYIE